MSEFAVGSTFTRHIAKELFLILVNYGLDPNYQNNEGMTLL